MPDAIAAEILFCGKFSGARHDGATRRRRRAFIPDFSKQPHLTETHLKDISGCQQMPGVHEMAETLCVENVGELRKTMLELAFGPQNDTSNLEEPIGAMAQNTRINHFEFLLAEQIRSSLLHGGDRLIGNRDFGSAGPGLEGIGFFF